MASPALYPAELGGPVSQDDQLQARLARSNEKKFVCNVVASTYLPDCKAAFSRQEHLQRHIRKHTGERPFSCGCGRTFTRLDNLRQHAQTVHSGTEMERVSEDQNVIAAATKMRPTLNSPHPRLEGGSDTDPYPRPTIKLARTKSRPTTREHSVETATPPPTSTRTSTPTPQLMDHPATTTTTPTTMSNPYDTITLMPSTLDHASVAVDGQHNHAPSYVTYADTMSSFAAAAAAACAAAAPPTATTTHYHSHDMESSVGSQPISSLAKRRTPKNEFVYTGGHMMHGTISATGYDSCTGSAAPDEGEQMSEYINNGLEPKATAVNAADQDRVEADGLEAMNLLSELAAA